MKEIPQATYDTLANYITSADSPVGIDATRTHVLIIHKLMELEKKLDAITQTLSERS